MVTTRSDDVAAIILAGELGPAQNSLSPAGPRSLLTLGHSRWLHLVFERCIRAEVTSIALCVNGLNPRLVEELHAWVERLDLRVLVDCVPRGSAGCCRDAADQFDAGTFLVIEGSTLPRFELAALLEHHRAEEAAVTLAVSVGDDPRRARPVGVSVLSRESLLQVPAVGFQDLKEGLITRLLAARRKSAAWMIDGACPRIRDLDTYLHAQRFVLEDAVASGVGTFDAWCSSPRLSDAPADRWPGVEFVGPVMVSADARVAPGAAVIGPAVIGPASRIDAGAVVAGSVVREDAVIGSGSLIRHSLLLPGARVEAGADCQDDIVVGNG